MKIVVAGGTGFLGRPLWERLASQKHDVVALTRGKSGHDASGRRVSWHPDGSSWAAGRPAWATEIDGADVVINLAGEGIADRRWTAVRKHALRESRLMSTNSLVAAIRAATARPSLFLSGSAIGYYGARDDRPVDESAPPGPDFLAQLCVDWEAAAREASAFGCRVVMIRTGVVLAAEGGALAKLILPFRLFAGGPIASGRQYMSWIHRDDWIGLVEWAIGNGDVTGPLNATAPRPVTNQAFSKSLGLALHRPSWLRVPAVALRLLVGEMADAALVNGQRVIPKRALDLGFAFKFTDIDQAMRDALSVPHPS